MIGPGPLYVGLEARDTGERCRRVALCGKSAGVGGGFVMHGGLKFAHATRYRPRTLYGCELPGHLGPFNLSGVGRSSSATISARRQKTRRVFARRTGDGNRRARTPRNHVDRDTRTIISTSLIVKSLAVASVVATTGAA
jgi:hypothetical protein